MAISKQKVIIALIPCIVTTLGIVIFLIFFNFSTITFQGESPFVVQAGNTSYNDTNGKVELHIRSGDYTFIVTKPDHFEQKVSETLAWKENKNINLTFAYKPKITTMKFVPRITYTAETPIIDNQSTDLLFARLSSQKVTLPAEYNRVVWAQDAMKACLFATQNSTLPPKLWSNAAAKNLPGSTFDCYATTQGLLIAQIENQKLLLNGKIVDFLLPQNFSITVNTTGQYMAITEKDGTNSMDKVTFIDLKTNKNTEIGKFNLVEPIRFIGLETIGIASEGTLAFYHPSLTTVKSLPAKLALSNLIYDANQETFYYIGSEEEVTTSILPSLNEFGLSSSSKAAVLSLREEKKQLIYTFQEKTQLRQGIMSADQKQIAFYAPDTNDLILLELKP